MKRLIFDVSTNIMYVAYVREEDIRDFSIRIAQRDHAKYLVDRIDQLLKRNRITLEQIDEIIIGIGPGSYTGIRIAVMVGKMLAYTKKIPLKTVSSLLFMTSGYKTPVAAMIDARRGNVFCGIYDHGKTLVEDGMRALTDFNQLPAFKTAEAVFLDEMSYEVDASVIIEHAVPVDDIHGLIPNYLRKTEAETKHDQTHD